MENIEEKRFRILVCVDGSDESYRGLRYAVRLGRGVDADVTLLFVRLEDQGLRSGGLNVQVARENILEWGLDLPGVRYLKKGQDVLVESGYLPSDWKTHYVHQEVRGDLAGDHLLEYRSQSGKSIRMRLKVAVSAASGILEQQAEGKHDLIILGASGKRRSGMKKFLGLAPVALKVATNAPCSVLVARDLEENKGHLLCTDGSMRSLDMVRKDAQLANRCDCPISLLSVAFSEEERPKAEQAIADACAALAEIDVPVLESVVRVGDPVSEIVEMGRNYSLIVVADAESVGLRRFLVGGTSFNVLEHAANSVMVVR